MSKLSAGLLLFRRSDDGIEVLIAHPGGPIWSRRDAGAWSLPKGAADDHEEDLLDAARREFRGGDRATGAPDGPVIDLGEVRMRSGKVVRAWAVEGDLDPAALRSMPVEVEWPPRSGRRIRVPEIDRVAVGAPGRGASPAQPRAGGVRGPAARRRSPAPDATARRADR